MGVNHGRGGGNMSFKVKYYEGSSGTDRERTKKR